MLLKRQKFQAIFWRGSKILSYLPLSKARQKKSAMKTWIMDTYFTGPVIQLEILIMLMGFYSILLNGAITIIEDIKREIFSAMLMVISVSFLVLWVRL